MPAIPPPIPPEPPALVRTVSAKPCDAATRARVLAPPQPGSESVGLTCSLTLGPGERVEKRLVVEGAAGSGVRLDCRGATIGRAGPTALTDFTIAIRSRPPAPGSDVWDRPSDVTITGCTILGHVRIWGMGMNGQGEALRLSSHAPGHTERAQAAAPTRVAIRDATITAQGPIPVYVAPGVTRFTLEGSRLGGRSAGTAVYLDAESADNAILDNDIAVETGREVIAVDGSARNRIAGNRVALGGQGGVRLYRNCGEGGTVRHQTPSDNVVVDNTFRGAGLFRAPIAVNSRGAWSLHCRADDGYPFGSSLDDADGGTGNVVAPNRVE